MLYIAQLNMNVKTQNLDLFLLSNAEDLCVSLQTLNICCH